MLGIVERFARNLGQNQKDNLLILKIILRGEDERSREVSKWIHKNSEWFMISNEYNKIIIS
jgi:hypothetical protein